MRTSAVIKKRVGIFFVSLIFIIVVLIATYFIFGKNVFNKDVLINSENIRVTFENGKKGIQFGSYPMSFQQGIDNSPSNIYKIVNKSEFSTKYQVILKDTSQSGDNIDINKLVVGINDDLVKSVKDISDGVLYEGILEPKNESILNLKFWLNEELITNDDKGNTLSVTIDIKEK